MTAMMWTRMRAPQLAKWRVAVTVFGAMICSLATTPMRLAMMVTVSRVMAARPSAVWSAAVMVKSMPVNNAMTATALTPMRAPTAVKTPAAAITSYGRKPSNAMTETKTKATRA